MGHERVLVLIPKEKAKNSFEARKFVLYKLIDEINGRICGEYFEPSIGGVFSGEMAIHAGIDEIVIPYNDKEMREVVRNGIGKIIGFINSEIEKSKEVHILASEIKREVPEFEVYNDGDLLDAFRLELHGIDIDITFDAKTGDVVYIFEKSSRRPEFWEQFWEKSGRYEFVDLGYEDDAILVNELLYWNLIEKHDIEVADIEKEKITPENVIGKKWAVLVDKAD